MDRTSERDSMSGIEPLSDSETSTPHNSRLDGCLADPDSLNSTGDVMRHPFTKPGFSPSPVKPVSNYSSPIVVTDSASFATAAQEITKRIQDSLASSLKLEKETEACLSSSLRNSNSANGTKSPSYSRTPTLSLSPSKSMSPSKLKVRFEDEALLTSDDLQSRPVNDPPDIFRTPIKSSRQDHLFTSPRSENTSPAKKDHMMLGADAATPVDLARKLREDSLLFSSLKLPQSDEEREKLFQFMQRMETSAAGDPLSSLFGMEYDLKLSELTNSTMAKTTNPAIYSQDKAVKAVKPGQKETGFQLHRKKPETKRAYGSKDEGKKIGSAKYDAKSHVRKNGVSKKNVQKKSTKENKPRSQSQKASATRTNSVPVTSEGQKTIGNMETIRNQLQGMMKMDGSLGCTPEVSEDYKLCFGGNEFNKPTGDAPDSFRSTDTATLLSANPCDFVPPSSSPDLAAGNVNELIDSATSSIFHLLRGNNAQPAAPTKASAVDSSVTAENNILRDILEKERYRRNHCEKQIQKLQNRILEIQQELAVGQSVARKKDMMIEQLDKTLAKVVHGWKGHEEKLVKTVEQLTLEKGKLTAEGKKQKETVFDLRNKLSKFSDELSNTQEKLQLKEEEQKLLQQTFQLKTHEISRVIDQKNASLEKLLNDKQRVVEDINKLTKKMEEIQEASEEEKEKYSRDLLRKKKELEDRLKLEKTKLEQEKSRNGDLQKMLSTAHQEVTRLEELMGSLRQTVDSLKMQGSVEEAKYASALRKTEAEHQIEMEKKVTEKLIKVHEQAEQKERELRDGHHKQMMEITSSHQTELENQCKMYEDRIAHLAQRARQDLEDKEKKFSENLKEKTESMRRQMINKMQNLLQAHYTETLDVVGSTTGNTPVRPPRYGTMSDLQLMRNSVYAAGSTLHDISNLNTSSTMLQDTLRQTDATLHDAFVSAAVQSDVTSNVAQSVSTVVSYPSATMRLPTTTSSVFNASTVLQPSIPHYVLSGVSQAASHSSVLDASIMTQYQQSTKPAAVLSNHERESFPDGHLAQPKSSVQAPVMKSFTQTAYEAEVNLPMNATLTSAPVAISENGSMSSPANQDGDRKQCLQHYIKMLLDRSPGEPLDVPRPSTAPVQPPPSISHLSPILEPSKVASAEDKENSTAETYHPDRATSEIALGVISFLNQQLNAKPSPDLIPVERPQAARSPQKQLKPQNPRSKPSAFHQIRMIPGVRPQQRSSSSGKTGVQKSPTKQNPAQLTLKDLDCSVSEKQVGDVSRMLGAYMSGDTQKAAEKLLSYLAESQNKANHVPSMSKSKGKSKTPAKGTAPVWR